MMALFFGIFVQTPPLIIVAGLMLGITMEIHASPWLIDKIRKRGKSRKFWLAN